MTLKEEARRSIEAIEQALRVGYKPPNIPRNKNEIGAITAAAQSMGISPTTLRSRVLPGGLCDTFGLKVNWNLWKNEVKEEPVQNREQEKTILGLQYEVLELKKKLTEANRNSLDEDAIRSILKEAVAHSHKPPEWLINTGTSRGTLPHVPVTIWSDWHASEQVRKEEVNGVNEYNFEIMEKRVRRLVERTIDLCRDHGPGNYPGIIVNLLGDFVSGGIHPELAKTDEEEVIPTALRTTDVLIWALTEILKEFKQVYCPCTSGNHGRATQKPEFKRYVFKNFDWLIYQLLYRHFKNNPNIIFDVPENNEVFYTVFGKRYLAMHGDMLGVKGGDGIIGAIGPIMRGEAKVGRQSSSCGQDYDQLLMGHYHQSLWLPRVIVANSLKGYDEFAKNVLRATPSIPSQPLWFVHPHWGKTAMMEIYLEDNNSGENEEWVTFRQFQKK